MTRQQIIDDCGFDPINYSIYCMFNNFTFDYRESRYKFFVREFSGKWKQTTILREEMHYGCFRRDGSCDLGYMGLDRSMKKMVIDHNTINVTLLEKLKKVDYGVVLLHDDGKYIVVASETYRVYFLGYSEVVDFDLPWEIVT